MSGANVERSDDIGRAAKIAAGLGLIFVVGALGVASGRAAVSVFIGAAIAVANLITMRAIIRALLPPPEEEDAAAKDDAPKPKPTNAQHKEAGRKGGVAWGIFAVLKILILFGGIWILLTRNLVDPMPLVVGYGVLPLGIALSALWPNLGPRR